MKLVKLDLSGLVRSLLGLASDKPTSDAALIKKSSCR